MFMSCYLFFFFSRECSSTGAIDPLLFATASKRAKCEGQSAAAAFYNFATPAVKAYLAAQGKPPKIMTTKCITPKSTAVQVPSFSITVNSTSTAPTTNSSTQSTSAVMGNPVKMSCNIGQPMVSLASGSPGQERRVHTMMLNHQNKMTKLEHIGDEVSNLNPLEQNHLKLAIHKLQLQRKLAEHSKRITLQQQHKQQLNKPSQSIEERHTMPSSSAPNLRVQMCGTNPPVYKVLRAQDVGVLDESAPCPIAFLKDVPLKPHEIPKVITSSPSLRQPIPSVLVKKEVLSPPNTPVVTKSSVHNPITIDDDKPPLVQPVTEASRTGE